MGEGEFICASDTPAIANFTNIILPMEDEEIALLTPLGIEIYDQNNERQYRNPVSLKVSEQIMDKMNFKHFMLKEIYDQPQTLKNWLENYLTQNLEEGNYQINYPFDTKFLESIERIEIIACGYDIDGRRNDWNGSGLCNDYVIEDNFGAWRENWTTVLIFKKIK